MPEPLTLQAAREQTIDALCRRFADDTITLVELERRLDRARSARTREELRTLLGDLPQRPAVPEPAGSARPSAQAREPAAPGRPRSGEASRAGNSAVVAVLGGTRRTGKWAPPRHLLSMAIMGGVELDFREAVMAPGSVITINCFAFWGGIEIVVPPDVHVELGGFALLGGFEQVGDEWGDPPDDAPTIEVNGFALMGGVEVSVRRAGQKRMSQKRRRERLERGGSADSGDTGDVGDPARRR